MAATAAGNVLLGTGAPDAFWVYEKPSEEDALAIAGMLAPCPGRVEVRVDGERGDLTDQGGKDHGGDE